MPGMPTTTPAVLRGGKKRFEGVEGTANLRSVGTKLVFPCMPEEPCFTERDDWGVCPDIGKGRGLRTCCGRDWGGGAAEGGGAGGCP